MAISCNGDTYVETIERTECIGNSLAKINANFAALDIAVCSIDGTASKLSNVQGIIKGDGNGNFTIADPDYDYYVPGRPLYTDFITFGKIQCAKDLTIGEGSLVVSKGNVGCSGLFANGNGSFGGTLNVKSTLTIGGKGSFEGEVSCISLTVNSAADINGTLNVANQIVGGSSLTVASVSTPSINVTGTSGSITVPVLNVSSAINANAGGVVCNLNRANISTASVSTLTATDGVFIGTRVQAGTGTISTLTSNTGNITTLTTTTGNITNVNSTTINANAINVNDINQSSPGTFNTNIANITTANIKNVNVVNMVNGQNVGTLNVAITQTSSLNATGDINGNNITATTRFNGSLAQISTINASSVNTASLGATNNINITGALGQTAFTIVNGNAEISRGNLVVKTANNSADYGNITADGTIQCKNLTIVGGSLSLSNATVNTLNATTTTTSNLSTTGDLYVGTGGARIAGGGLIVSAGNLNVTAGSATFGNGATVSAGNLSVASGSGTFGNGVTISAGNLGVTAGNATIGGTLTVTGVASQTSISLTNGNLSIGGGGSFGGNLTVTGTASQTSFSLTNGNLNVANGNISASGGLTLTSGNIAASSGALTIKSITTNGTAGTEGVITATQKVVTPALEVTGVNGITASKVTISGSGQSLTFSSGSTIKMDEASSSISLRGAGSTFIMDGSNSVFTGRSIVCSLVTCSGDVIAFAASDKRLKKNITVIDNSLDKISKLSGVNFDWDTELQDVHEGADTGVIAQEVEEVMPTAVTTRENGYKAVKYDRLIPLLIEAVKELKEQNVALKEELDSLKCARRCK